MERNSKKKARLYYLQGAKGHHSNIEDQDFSPQNLYNLRKERRGVNMFSRRAKQWARIFVTSLCVLFLIRAGLESVSASELNNNPADYNDLYCIATYTIRTPTDLDKNTLASIISGKVGLLKNVPTIPLDIDNSLIITQSGEDLWLIPNISKNKFKIVFAVIKDDKLQGISLSLGSSDTKNPTIILSDLKETISYEIRSDKAQMIVDSVAPVSNGGKGANNTSSGNL